MKKVVFIFIATILLSSCTNHKENMEKIGQFVSNSVKELKQLQLDSAIRYKQFDFNGQLFTIYFDSTGKPIFVNDELKKIDELILKIEDNNYSVKMEDGKVEISLD